MRLLGLTITFFANLVLCCKSESKTSSIGGEISFFSNNTDKASIGIKALAEDFQSEHPGTTIQVFAYKRAREHLDQLFKAGQLYDVAPLPLTMEQQVFSQYLLPLDDLGVRTDDVAVEGKGLGADGKVYAVVTGVNYLGMIYNRAAFAKAGISTPPRTFDELLSACSKLARVNITPIELNYRELWTLERYTRSLTSLILTSANQSVDDIEVQRSWLEPQGAMGKVYRMMIEMTNKQCFGDRMLTSLWDENKERFANGLIGMSFLETWYLPQVTGSSKSEADFGMFPFPGVDFVAVTSDGAIGISNKTANPQLSLAWLKYIFEGNRLHQATNSFVVRTETGLNPILTDLFAMTKAVVPIQDLINILGRAEGAGINFETVLQEILVASEPEKIIELYREQWLATFK